jgi:WD40 repeat protein
MNVISAKTYPLLLTRIEEGTESHHYYKWSRSDVWRADYTQGDTLEGDTLSQLRKFAARRGADERGLAWKDSRSAWILRDGEVQLVGPGHKPQALCTTKGWQMAPSASQRYFWTVERDADSQWCIRQLDGSTGESRFLPWHSGSNSVSLAADPQKDRLLVFHHDENTELYEWNPSQGQLIALPCPLSGPIVDPAFSPDGQKLAFVADYHEVHVHDFASGKTTQISNLEEEDGQTLGDTKMHFSPSWSPDGKRVFYTLYSELFTGDTIDEWSALFVATPDGRERMCLLPFDDRVQEVQTSWPAAAA